ncbi:MAG TPA: hypothetical protein VGV91_10385 [Rubrobacter sp.]|nr:hypothetical protein [Rubrobacter sp.]
MRESCYCGRVGEVEDREPVLRDGRTEALRCRRCGHLDPLPWLDAAARHSVFEEAERRSLERLAEGTWTGHGREGADRTGTLGGRRRPRSG